MIAFDIETGPLDQETVLARSKPFEPPKHPGEFDPSTVKYGNTKDKDKRAAKLADEQKKHQLLVERYQDDCKQQEQDHVAQLMSKAGLTALTGEVLAIGVKSDKGWLAIEGAEADILAKFWSRTRKWLNEHRTIVGCNIFNFDLPFMVRRSWIHEVPVPSFVMDKSGRWNTNSILKDLVHRWTGRNYGEYISLDLMAKSLGHPGKPEVVSGADFHRLWKSKDPEVRAVALDYLRNDLDMTWYCANRMGVV